jgi:hypothetical protein
VKKTFQEEVIRITSRRNERLRSTLTSKHSRADYDILRVSLYFDQTLGRIHRDRWHNFFHQTKIRKRLPRKWWLASVIGAGQWKTLLSATSGSE